MAGLTFQREDLPLIGMRRLTLTATEEVVLGDVVDALVRHGAWVEVAGGLDDGSWLAVVWQSTILPPYSFTVQAAAEARDASRKLSPSIPAPTASSVQTAARRLRRDGR